MFARYEWALLELLVLAFLIYELVKIRRIIRHDREAKAKEQERAPDA